MAIKDYFSIPESLNPGTQDGTSAGNDLAQSKYKFDYTVFPEDLGMDHYGHYMIFNINVPTEGIATGMSVRSPAGDLYKQNRNLFTPLIQSSKVDTLRFGNYNNFGGGQKSGANVLPRQTRRIAESVALYIPGGFTFMTQNEYQDIDMTSKAGELLAGATTAVTTAAGATVGGGAGAGLGYAVGRFITGIVGEAGQMMGDVGAIMQNPINPSVEVLFTNVRQRQFSFTFLMCPRNEKESETIKKIVATLRYHAAPEINMGVGGLGMGLTWIPPADFDITFMNKGKENLNMLRINTCALLGVEVNYAPFNVHSTFRNGHPVSVIMTLNFKELEPISKIRVLQGF